MRKKCKEYLDKSIESLSNYPAGFPEGILPGSYVCCCYTVIGEIIMAYAMGYITPEQANSYKDIVYSFIHSVCPEAGDVNA